MKRGISGMIVVAALAGVSGSAAGVSAIEIFKSEQWRQDVVHAPAQWVFASRVFETDLNDFDSVTMTIPSPPGDGSELSLTPGAPPRDGQHVFFASRPGSLADLQAEFAPGDYTFRYYGGTFDGVSDVMTLPAVTIFPDRLPVLTSGLINELRAHVPSTPLLVEWDGFTVEGEVSQMFVFVQVIRQSDGAELYGAGFPNTGDPGSVLIQGTDLMDLLEVGQNYILSLTYSAILNQTPLGGESEPLPGTSALRSSRFERNTFMEFTPIPEPAALSVLAPVGLLLGRRRRMDAAARA